MIDDGISSMNCLTRNFLRIIGLVFLLATIGCGGEENMEPTPFAEATATATITINKPLALPITDLAASPAFFEGTMLQLTGQFQRLPKLICANESFSSPATWGLVADGLLAQAGGFDAPLRSLIPDNLTMTVEGRWQRWQGPVGCGKRAVQQDLWYLEVTEIISPSPLTQVTLTPDGNTEAEQVAQVELGQTTPTAVSPDNSVPTLPPPNDEDDDGDFNSDPPPPEDDDDDEPPAFDDDDATPTATAVSPLIPSLTPSPTSIGSSGDGINNTPTPTPSATATAIRTRAPGQPTNTPVPIVTNTSTPTATPTDGNGTGGGTVISQDTIFDEDLLLRELGAGETHEWIYDVFNIDTTFAITISVVSLDADIAISLLDPNNEVLVESDGLGAGSVESIDDYLVRSEGEFKIHVESRDNVTADYAIIVTSEDSDSHVFVGTLEDGVQASVALVADAFHYWFFKGNNGDSLNVTLAPSSSESDLGMDLFFINSSETDRKQTADDYGVGVSEELDTFLDTTGMYYLRIEEFLTSATESYTINFTLD